MGQHSQFRKYLVSVSVITLSQTASRNTSFECVRTVVSQPMSLPAAFTLKLHRQPRHPTTGRSPRDVLEHIEARRLWKHHVLHQPGSPRTCAAGLAVTARPRSSRVPLSF